MKSHHIYCMSFVFPEIIPPVLELCPSDMDVTTSNTYIEVTKPRVIFRSQSGNELPHTCNRFGQLETHNFTIGTYNIECKASDPGFGEIALTVCRFKIQVKSKSSFSCVKFLKSKVPGKKKNGVLSFSKSMSTIAPAPEWLPFVFFGTRRWHFNYGHNVSAVLWQRVCPTQIWWPTKCRVSMWSQRKLATIYSCSELCS